MDENIKERGEGEGFKLKDLLDSSYPLLKEFRDACPGTYKHSQALVSMIEGISLELELDVDSMKVMAQYHDIGKMINPEYFTENQLDEENPHKDLEPFVSYQFITRHVSDTTMILIDDPNFPREIIKKMSQHHGTTILLYFADKVGDEDKDKFRYRTHKPASIEAMVLMICDNIEARSRSYIQSGKKVDPSDVIDGAINTLTTDGQLDALTLGDLRKIKKALRKELEGTYQKRVSYPDDEKETEDYIQSDMKG
jgi:putative nucleotidyltransferase with HDIG domain